MFNYLPIDLRDRVPSFVFIKKSTWVFKAHLLINAPSLEGENKNLFIYLQYKVTSIKNATRQVEDYLNYS